MRYRTNSYIISYLILPAILIDWAFQKNAPDTIVYKLIDAERKMENKQEQSGGEMK